MAIVPEISLWVRLAVVVATRQRLARESEHELQMKSPGRLAVDSKRPFSEQTIERGLTGATGSV
jgi:hypothetical protein